MFEVTETKRIARTARSERDATKRSRVHVFQDGESVLDNLQDRFTRPSKLYREVVLAQFPELKDKLNWSQKAGCGCGCSPGFVVSETLRDEKSRPLDIYITAKFS